MENKNGITHEEWKKIIQDPDFLLKLAYRWSEETERELAMFMNKVLITKCSELWVFGNSYTAGMNAEIIYAIRKDKPIHYFNENMEELR